MTPKVLAGVGIPAGQPELRMVEDIEKLCPEIYVRTLTERQGNTLDDREIGIHKVRSVERGPGSISSSPDCGSTKHWVLNHLLKVALSALGLQIWSGRV